MGNTFRKGKAAYQDLLSNEIAELFLGDKTSVGREYF